MAAILSSLGLYGGNQKMKLPLRDKTKIHTPEGNFWNLRRRHHRTDVQRLQPAYPRRKPCDPNACPPLWSLRKASSHTGQTGTHRSDRPDAAALRSSVLALWINQETQWFCGQPLETPQTWCSLSPISTHDLTPTSSDSTLVLRLNQETVYDSVLLFLPPCGPHLTWPPDPSN
jgi:hypothetical protein